MLNLLSLFTGTIALLIALLGFAPIPLLPLLNWIALPIAIVGLAFGMVSSRNEGRNLNLLVAIVAGLRLFLTGGLI